MSTEPSTSARAPSNRALNQRAVSRSAGRLAAVQAIYQILQSEADVDSVLRDYVSGNVGRTAITENQDSGQETYVELAEAETEILVNIVRCWQDRGSDIDGMIAGSLSAGWPLDRLEILLKCILTAGIAEMLCRDDIPPRVTISEFVDIAKAFYTSPEPGLVNAVLDRIARSLDRLTPKGQGGAGQNASA